jgi:hypothetical protein
MAGTVIYEAHPTMFRAHPFWFIGCIILIPVFGLGVLLLLYWYIHTRQTALTVTDRAALREGHPEQGSHLSLAQARPRRARDARVPEPYPRRWDYPNLNRRRSAGVHGGGHAGPRHDQRGDLESAEPRNGLGPACRARTTIAITRRHGSCSLRRSRSSCWSRLYRIYYFVEYANFSDPFAAGLGLKNAALISFDVSLAVILVMAVVSGGDAIFGELPFTIAGFLIFFVVFWLKIAWIF